MTPLLGAYQNGNYAVSIYSDGTKIKESPSSTFIAAFPESIDVKITNYCPSKCAYCHEDSSPTGEHGDILNAKFLDTLPPYIEAAIGGGDPLSHPDLIPFLHKLKSLKIIPNITVNSNHFTQPKYQTLIQDLISNQLIYGLGISAETYSDELLEEIKKYPNAVLHCIAGLVPVSTLSQFKHQNLKILFLGYKQLRRGAALYAKHQAEINKNKISLMRYLPILIQEKWFQVISFDNLALSQLHIQKLLTEESWNNMYQGEDGSHSMYIDLVTSSFAVSSNSTTRYPLQDNIQAMFQNILKEK